MLIVKANINRLLPNIQYIIKQFCTKSNKTDSGVFNLAGKDSFSAEENAKILETINESTREDLSRYKLSNKRIHDIFEWKEQRGPFTSISEVLEVEGFGEKNLQALCTRIVTNDISGIKRSRASRSANRQIKSLLIPELGLELCMTLQSAVAVHLDPTGIGWAKLQKEGNNITFWKCKNFSSLPAKMLPSDIFNLAVNIVRATPPGDVYIFESPPNLGPQSQAKQALISAHNQQVELLSMLLPLLNTSVKHNNVLQKSNAEKNLPIIENKVFYLKNKIPARLFKTLIGFEKVSAISKITGIVNKDPEVVRSLPCTPVEFDSSLNHSFLSQSSANKELLAQALMLGVSFMDLCIRRNRESFAALTLRCSNGES